MSKLAAIIVALTATTVTPVLAQHRLAFSDRLGVDVYAIGTPWCAANLNLDLRLREGSSLTDKDELVAFIPKLKTPIENDCPTAVKIEASVSGPGANSILPIMVANKINGWVVEPAIEAPAAPNRQTKSNGPLVKSGSLVSPACAFALRQNDNGKYVLTESLRRLPLTPSEQELAEQLSSAFNAPPLFDWTSREVGFVKSWFATCVTTLKSEIRIPRGPDGIRMLGVRDSLESNERVVSRGLDRQLSDVNQVRRAADEYITRESTRLANLKLDQQTAAELSRWSIPANYQKVLSKEQINERLKTSVLPIIDASLKSYLDSLALNAENYRIVRSGCCQWRYGDIRAPSDEYLDQLRARFNQSVDAEVPIGPSRIEERSGDSQSLGKTQTEQSSVLGIMNFVGSIALLCIAGFGIFNLYKHSRLPAPKTDAPTVQSAGISFSSNPLNLILNLLWLIPIGAILGLGWLASAILLAASVVGLPWAFAALTMSSLAVWPFGRDVIKQSDLTGNLGVANGSLSLVGNIIWFALAGLWLALGHAAAGVLSCATLIGIPFGVQHFKLAGTAIAPVGKIVVSKEVASEVRRQRAAQSVNAYRDAPAQNAPVS
jgi:uncharacterized membrane protein YccF (DUF307 family)